MSGRGDEYDRLALTINRSFEEVERLVGSLRAATEGLAHDLKTPLTRVRARLELADLEGADGVRLRDPVAESRQDIETILQLIEDVLGLARAEATGVANFTPIDLDVIVAEALELYELVAAERDVRLEQRIEPAQLNGSRWLLAQMTINLIDDAIKYTPAGGRVAIELANSERAIRLAVADGGPGIAEAQRERALQRFARLDPSRSQPGSGLGLSIVAAAARVHRASPTLSDNAPGLRVEILFPPP